MKLNMKNPLISIIVPVYNVEKYLRECLESLINQTYDNVEIICFNDASTDNSLSILEEYACIDDRVKVINSSINVKQGGGRNRALKLSKGEYICFVDSDDWIDKHFVEMLYSAISTFNADIAIADCYEYNNGHLKEITYLGKNIQCSTIELKRKILLNGCPLPTSIFRRNLIFDNNLFFPEGVFYEDNAVGPAIFLSARKIIKIDNSLYYYRMNPTSTTHRINDYRFFDRLETSLLALNNIKKLSNFESELAILEEEIEWRFIRLYFIGTLFGVLSRFKPIPIDRVNSLFNGITTYIPAWRKNRYYRKKVSILRRILIKLLSYFPKATCIILERILIIKKLIYSR